MFFVFLLLVFSLLISTSTYMSWSLCIFTLIMKMCIKECDVCIEIWNSEIMQTEMWRQKEKKHIILNFPPKLSMIRLI